MFFKASALEIIPAMARNIHSHAGIISVALVRCPACLFGMISADGGREN
jgi:hypothetical protein